jgi:hypothetical protein
MWDWVWTVAVIGAAFCSLVLVYMAHLVWEKWKGPPFQH